MQRFRGVIVFKAHRLCVSLNSRLESNIRRSERELCLSWVGRICWISSGEVLMIDIQTQRKLSHTWIIWVIVKEHLVQIGRIDRPTEYLSWILAVIRFESGRSPRRWNALSHHGWEDDRCRVPPSFSLFVAYRLYIVRRQVFLVPCFLHFEPSLDALTLRSDVITSIDG